MADWHIRGLYEVPVRDENLKRAVREIAAAYDGGPITVTILPRRRWWHRFSETS